MIKLFLSYFLGISPETLVLSNIHASSAIIFSRPALRFKLQVKQETYGPDRPCTNQINSLKASYICYLRRQQKIS